MIKLDHLITHYENEENYEHSENPTIVLLAANIRAYRESLYNAGLRIAAMQNLDSRRALDILTELEQYGIDRVNARYKAQGGQSE